MKRLRFRIAVVVTVVVLLSTVCIASAQDNANPRVLPPDSLVQGLTYGEWSVLWWQSILSIPTSQNPLTGATGADCIYERLGNVGLVMVHPQAGQVLKCEVPAGMMLFLDILSVECSTLEPPPFYGEDEEALRACALSFNLEDLEATIDGVDVENLGEYIHTSPPFIFAVPEDNILGVEFPTLTGKSVSNGAHLLLAPLSPGGHTIYLHGVVDIEGEPFTVDMDFELTVTQ
jgi:hypothetical protein